ncbi:MAG: hypothetical protein K2H76_01230 [Muribaculaceae bacterium]|nr:hypothetical protein [Muribaculaceae bacterium]
MKRLLNLIILMISCISSFAYGDFSYEIQCNLYVVRPHISENPEEDPIPRHTPSAPVLCTISSDRGIEFLNGITPDILYYELADEDGMLMTFSEESEFVQTLFSSSGEVKIVIATPQWDYVGYIEL